MSSRKTPALLALAGVVLAVVLFLVLKDDTSDDATLPDAQQQQAGDSKGAGGTKEKPDKPKPPPVPSVEIRNGKPVGGVAELEFKSGEQAKFEVAADAVDELHFHGYDLYVDVGPDKVAKVSFKADIEGLFEVESHSTGELIAEVSVVP